MSLNSFGVAIPVTGPNNGFPGSVTRMGDRGIISKIVDSSASANGIPFGAGIIELSNANGGSFLSFADYLATIANVATFQQKFAGIGVRNVKTQFQYASLVQSSGTTTVSTTATQATVGSTTIVVASATGIVVGMFAAGAGLAAGCGVTGINGTTITISLATTAVLSTTAVLFTQQLSEGVTGFYATGQMCDDIIDGSVLVTINNGSPQANLAVYVRAVANANIAGTSVGDFEAADDVATTSITTSTTVGSATLTTSAGTNVAIGQRVTAPGVPPNTYLTAGATTSWTMSQQATATTATQAASFSNMILLGDSINPWIRFRTGNLDQNNAAEVTILVRHAA